MPRGNTSTPCIACCHTALGVARCTLVGEAGGGGGGGGRPTVHSQTLGVLVVPRAARLVGVLVVPKAIGICGVLVIPKQSCYEGCCYPSCV